MFRHGHRRGKLSLPSIRISTAPDPLTSSSGPSTGQALSASSPAQHNGHVNRYPSRGESTISSTAALSETASGRDSRRGSDLSPSPSHATAGHLGPAFQQEPLSGPDSRREGRHDLFRSLCPQEATEKPAAAALDPFMPEDLVEKIQEAMRNCTEYERQCAQLEHSIEHKILMWSQILEQYEGQDHTALELREIISSSQAALKAAEPTMQNAESIANSADNALNRHEQTLAKAKEIIEQGKSTMSALEELMQREEVVQKNIGRWQNAMLGTGIALVLVIAILLAWLLS